MQTDGDKQAEKQIRHTRLKPEEKKRWKPSSRYPEIL